MATAFAAEPSRIVPSRDGTPIAVFAATSDGATARETPLLLVHGTGSDHTTWRVLAPVLAARGPVHALDRRGRGGSGDGPRYTAAREAEDVAAVAEALADEHGAPVAVVGHSLGGRLALAASPRSRAVGWVVAYEGAPGVPGDPARPGEEALLARLVADLAAGDHDAILATFMREAVGLPEDDLEAFRASDLWARRAATAPTIVRELDAALHDDAIALHALAAVTVPVLQLTGSRSPARFRDGATALDARLARGRIVRVDGARHAAHHSHPGEMGAAIDDFLTAIEGRR